MDVTLASFVSVCFSSHFVASLGRLVLYDVFFCLHFPEMLSLSTLPFLAWPLYIEKEKLCPVYFCCRIRRPCCRLKRL